MTAAFMIMTDQGTSTRLPEKGPTTGSIIGAIIGVIILLAIIGTAIAMYRKHSQKKRDGPPKFQPPPPKKTNSSANRTTTVHSPVPEDRPLQNEYYNVRSDEPVTNLDTYQDGEDDDDYDDAERQNPRDRVHYHSAAPSGWDDPEDNEVPPPYLYDNQSQPAHQDPAVNRGDSFVSSAMFV